MAATHDAELAAVAATLVDDSTRTLFRDLLAGALQDLIEAELTGRIGAEPHERTDARTGLRNGHRPRLLSTPAGDVALAIPKTRTGSFFPSLLEPRRRVDHALWAVIMTAYVTGTSTRKVDDLVRALGVDAGVSKSTVSRICADSETAQWLASEELTLALTDFGSWMGFVAARGPPPEKARSRSGGSDFIGAWLGAPSLSCPPFRLARRPPLRRTTR